MIMTPQQYCLRWKHHHSNVQNMFAQLLEKERFCDVTLYCSPNFATQVPNKDTVDPQNIRGVSLRAHRVVLAACSELLGTLLTRHDALGEPVLVIDGAEPRHLRALLHYMYTGEMSVHPSQLASLLKTAEELRIKGLTDIRWNNKDEPPDYQSGGIITTTSTTSKRSPERKTPSPKPRHSPKPSPKPEHKPPSPINPINVSEQCAPELNAYLKKEDGDIEGHGHHKFSVNGGPPPLIKLPAKDKGSPAKRENSDTDTTQSPKRQRLTSGCVDNSDDESQTYSVKTEKDQEWHHGNMDISAERVVGWGSGLSPAPTGSRGEGSWSRSGSDDEWADAPADIGSFLHTRLRVDGDNSNDTARPCVGSRGEGSWSRSGSDDEWADAPADIGSFLHTRLRVDGDNSNDDESNDSGPASVGASSINAPMTSSPMPSCGVSPADIKVDMLHAPMINKQMPSKSSGPVDPRFSDVVKLNDYLQHGRRPQFWEENYVRRVMEAVRLKELEMKQAAEILGVSYGTLYGRYRDVYGCINRPYRTARDFWQAKGPSEVLERLQRGEVSLDAASQALGVTASNLAAYVADLTSPEKEFEPIPIEIDPSLKIKPSRPFQTAQSQQYKPRFKPQPTVEKAPRKIIVGSVEDEDIPATVIATATPQSSAGKWPTLRVAQLDTLRDTLSAGATSAPGGPSGGAPTSPSQLMRTRPDLTIVAAKRSDKKDDE